MVTDGAADQHHVSLLDVSGGKPRPGQGADAGGIDVDAIALPPFHHLGVTGDHLDAAFLRRLRNGSDNAPQVCHRQTLLQNEAQAQVLGRAAAHGDVVHRAADAQLPDVAAGEKVGADHIAVRGEHQVALAGQDRPVAQGGQRLVGKGRHQHLLDEAGGLFAAAAVV